jgi:nucleotide-binding universal stress UspA family protein
VEAALALEPDLLVLAIGNNEHTMTSYYTGWPARHPVTFYRVSETLGSLQLYGLLGRALGGGLPKPSEAFERRVELDDPVARAVYSARRRPPDLSLFDDALASPEVTRLLEQEQRLKERIYRDRLEDMVRRAQDAGVPVLLATLPYRLRTPPVLSGVHGGDPDTVRALMRQLREGGGRPNEAAIRQGLELDPRVAHFQYAQGELLLARGDRAGAAAAFRAQADWELVPDGTPSLEAIVREVAADQGCGLVDLATLSELSLDPGRALFLDRVHVSAEGARLVAEAFEDPVRSQLGLPIVPRGE